MNAPGRFEWVKGAAWLLPDGSLHIVPGFHDEWIAAHRDLAPGCSNVAEVVSRLGWLSVVSYAQGYVEFMIRSRQRRSSYASSSSAATWDYGRTPS
jgi:hypothetical protein